MINRREVMASGIALSLYAGTAATGAPEGDPWAFRPGQGVYIADFRFDEAIPARTVLEGFGAHRIGLGWDVEHAYKRLYRILGESPSFVAGFSTPNSMFPLERLGWDKGLRTVYRGIHRRGTPQTDEYFGSPAIADRIRRNESGDWATGLGLALAQSSTKPEEHRQLVTSQMLPQADSGVFVSWLQVPRETLPRELIKGRQR